MERETVLILVTDEHWGEKHLPIYSHMPSAWRVASAVRSQQTKCACCETQTWLWRRLALLQQIKLAGKFQWGRLFG